MIELTITFQSDKMLEIVEMKHQCHRHQNYWRIEPLIVHGSKRGIEIFILQIDGTYSESAY